MGTKPGLTQAPWPAPFWPGLSLGWEWGVAIPWGCILARHPVLGTTTLAE